ncbi:MAG: T9SS type A sorting domain-containing protein, partial [Bacteroidota bacterium]
DHLFENCIIEDIGRIGIFASAIYSRTGPITVQNCTFGEAGRFHLRLRSSDKIEVYDSDFYGAMMMGEDAGPIEATSTGSLYPLNLKESVFAYNKVHDCHGIPVFDGGYAKQFVVAFYMEDTDNYTAHHNLVYNITADNYTGPHNMDEAGAFLYLGPRYNYMDRPVNYYNNTVWNYQKNINIWHIEAENWQDLGMPNSGGSMQDGHFENNIFQQGPSFKMNWTKQILNSTGGRVAWVSVPNPPKIETSDFQAFVSHCQNQGYFFNASHTRMLDKSNEAQNFTNAAQGDFTLLNTSPAWEAGKVIPGITSDPNPDCGALEGGNRVLNAGANLQLPDFLEVGEPLTSINAIAEGAQLQIYPNPAEDYLMLASEQAFIMGEIMQIYSLDGKLMSVHQVEKSETVLRLPVAHLPAGMYILRRTARGIKGVQFIKR